jgi:FAD/FMN-containing dehydrogenase
VAALDVVLGDGRVATLGAGRSSSLDSALAAVGNRWSDDIAAELGRFSRQVSGYGLQHLLAGDGFDPARAFVGSEGTCGQVVEATLHLVELPAARSLVVAGFVDIVAAAAAAPLLAGIGPLTVEGMGADLVQAFDTTAGPRRRRPLLPSGQAWLLIEVGGGTVGHCAEVAHQAVRLAAEAGALQTCIVTAADEQQALWSPARAGNRSGRTRRSSRAVAGLGGRRRTAGTAGFLPHGLHGAAARARPQRQHVRALR